MSYFNFDLPLDILACLTSIWIWSDYAFLNKNSMWAQWSFFSQIFVFFLTKSVVLLIVPFIWGVGLKLISCMSFLWFVGYIYWNENNDLTGMIFLQRRLCVLRIYRSSNRIFLLQLVDITSPIQQIQRCPRLRTRVTLFYHSISCAIKLVKLRTTVKKSCRQSLRNFVNDLKTLGFMSQMSEIC